MITQVTCVQTEDYQGQTMRQYDIVHAEEGKNGGVTEWEGELKHECLNAITFISTCYHNGISSFRVLWLILPHSKLRTCHE